MLARLAYLWTLIWKDVPLLGRGIFAISALAGVAAAYMMVHLGYGPSVAMFSLLVSMLAVAVLAAFRAVQDGYEKRKLVEGGLPDARLSLEWRNGGLVMRVFNKGADAEFDAKIDLSQTRVVEGSRRIYAGIWADDPAGTTKKIFERGHEFLALYDILNSGAILTPTFICKTGIPYRNSISAIYSYCPLSHPPVEPETHVLRVSVSSTPRMVGGTKHAEIQIRGSAIVVLSGDVKAIHPPYGPGAARIKEETIENSTSMEGAPLDQWIPLREVAAQLYGELRGTYLGKTMEEKSKTSDDVLDHAGYLLAGRVALEVRKSPSPKWERLDRASLSEMVTYGGSVGFRMQSGDHAIVFDEVRFPKQYLETAIQEIKEMADTSV